MTSVFRSLLWRKVRPSDSVPSWSASRIGLLLALITTALITALIALRSDSGAALAQTAPTITAVAITSSAGSDATYALGETIRVTLSFSEAVDVTGAPSLAIDMDPAHWGTKWAAYASGGGSSSVVFAHTVVEPNYSSQGIAVLADSLKLNGGTIASSSSGTAAALSHTGLGHDANHKVDWQQSSLPLGGWHRVPTPAPPPAPTVLALAITSDPGDDDTYAMDDVIEVTVSFSEAVAVGGTPQIAIDMDPANWGTKWAAYARGSGSNVLTFAHTVVEPNTSTQGVAVLANTLRLNGGTIASSASGSAANLAHAGLAHDTGHKVDWQLAAESDCEQVAPSSVSALTIGQGAVVSWTLPADLSDACEVTGFVVTGANAALRIDSEAIIPDPEARSHTMRGLNPGDWVFSVRVQYAEGDSDEYVMAEANSVPDACITLAVKPHSRNAVSGKIASVNGTGCMTRQMFNFEFKRTADDYWYHYGRFPWSLVSAQTDANTPDFILYDLLEPFVSYDFRIRAYDASDSEYTTTAQSVTLSAHDPSATADAGSPADVRAVPANDNDLLVDWSAYTAPAGRTWLGMVVEWKVCSNANSVTDPVHCDGIPADTTLNVAPGSTPSSHRITGLTHDQYYVVRVAARTHLSSQPASTATNAWSVWTPAARTWFEPTQIWLVEGTPSFAVGRIFLMTENNKNHGNSVCFKSVDSGTADEQNCPRRNLVHGDATGTNITVWAVLTIDGVATFSTRSSGQNGGPRPPEVGASGGNGRIVVDWGSVSDPTVGSLDKFIVRHRSGTSGNWTETDKAVTDRTHTITGLTSGTYQVEVRARSDGDDGDPMTTDSPILGFTSTPVTLTVSADKTETVIPAQVSVTPGDSQSLVVEWEVPDGVSGAHAYQVRHRADGTTTWTESEILFPLPTQRICELGILCQNPRSYEIEDLTGGTRYEVQVRAKNANGWALNKAGEAVWSHTRAARPND